MTRSSVPQNGNSSHLDNTKVLTHFLTKSSPSTKELKLYLSISKLLEGLSQQLALLEKEIELFQFLLLDNSQPPMNADWSQKLLRCSMDLAGRLHIMQLMMLHILANLGE